MSYGYAEFASQAQTVWNKYNNAVSIIHDSNLATEWAAILTALASDTRTHDKTISLPPAALSIQAPGVNTKLVNEINLLINRGLGGNLTQSQMISALGAASGTAEAPGSISHATIFASASPPISGTVLTVVPGAWAGAPTSRTYTWTRDGTTIAGATATTYTLVSADVGGHAIRAVESAVNATGTTVGPPSNHVQVP